jgi:SAM-dependent methyltransferase
VLAPPASEPEIVHAAIPSSAEILELGCGAGRITHRLVELGHPVVGVGQSPEMLANVQGAETVLTDIEALDLGRTFPVVLLSVSGDARIGPTRFEDWLDKSAFAHAAQRGQTEKGSG